MSLGNRGGRPQVGNWDVDAATRFWRQKTFDSFWWFFKDAWGYDFNPKGGGGTRPWLAESTHKQACDWFEMHALDWLTKRRAGKGEPKKLMAIVPRDWGKTTLFAQAGQTWLHVHDNDLATYTGSESLLRAKEILAGIKAVVSGEDRYARFTKYFGNWYDQSRKWKTEEVVTAVRTNLTRRDASFGTWGVGTGLVGLHPDACFFDDPNTYERMERDADWLGMVNRHQDTLIPVFQSDAFWMLTGTRYGDADNLGESLKHEGVASVTGMPMDDILSDMKLSVDPDGAWHLFFMDAVDERIAPWDPANIDEQSLTMPKIWSKKRMRDFYRRNPERFFAQIRNNPTRSTANPLTRTEAESLRVRPDEVNFKDLFISLHVDVALKAPQQISRGDYNVIEVWGHRRKGTGKVVRVDCKYSTEWGAKQFIKELVDTVVEWRTKAARVVCMTCEKEPGGQGDAWKHFIQNGFAERGIIMPTYIETPALKLNKIRAIINAAAIWQQRKVELLTHAPGLDIIIEQMSKIGKTKFDDFADAASQVFFSEVYQVMSRARGESSAETGSAYPFDEVLKPASEWSNQTEVLNKWADQQLQQEEWQQGQWDIVTT